MGLFSPQRSSTVPTVAECDEHLHRLLVHLVKRTLPEKSVRRDIDDWLDERNRAMSREREAAAA